MTALYVFAFCDMVIAYIEEPGKSTQKKAVLGLFFLMIYSLQNPSLSSHALKPSSHVNQLYPSAHLNE